MADAPSFSTSTRSMAATGMWLTSTVVLSVRVPPAATRLPSINTRVRWEPRPRSETLETPPVVEPDAVATTRSEERRVGTECGEWRATWRRDDAWLTCGQAETRVCR